MEQCLPKQLDVSHTVCTNVMKHEFDLQTILYFNMLTVDTIDFCLLFRDIQLIDEYWKRRMRTKIL